MGPLLSQEMKLQLSVHRVEITLGGEKEDVFINYNRPLASSIYP